MKLLPTEINMPDLPYEQEISDELTALKADPVMKNQLGSIEIPDLSAMKTVSINMSSGSGAEIPADTLAILQSSDVTTITDNTKLMAKTMFAQMSPELAENIQNGIDKGIKGINTGRTEMEKAAMMMSGKTDTGTMMPSGTDTVSADTGTMMPSGTDVSAMISAAAGMESSIKEMDTLSEQLQTLRDAVPGAFDSALDSYLSEIENKRELIEDTFQSTLNKGFYDVYLTTAIAAAAALFFLVLYDRKKESD